MSDRRDGYVQKPPTSHENVLPQKTGPQKKSFQIPPLNGEHKKSLSFSILFSPFSFPFFLTHLKVKCQSIDLSLPHLFLRRRRRSSFPEWERKRNIYLTSAVSRKGGGNEGTFYIGPFKLSFPNGQGRRAFHYTLYRKHLSKKKEKKPNFTQNIHLIYPYLHLCLVRRPRREAAREDPASEDAVEAHQIVDHLQRFGAKKISLC